MYYAALFSYCPFVRAVSPMKGFGEDTFGLGHFPVDFTDNAIENRTITLNEVEVSLRKHKTAQ